MAHILLVDDDKDILKLVQRLLEQAGHVVVSCSNPHDALDRWNREMFDLVLSDANMPHINGFHLVKTISQNSRNFGTAVALLTGRRDKKDVEYGLECGADDYIVKPIDPMLFIPKIESLLAIKASQKMEVHFNESPIRIKAKWETDTEITHLSEHGLTLFSYIYGAKNSKIKIESDLFNLIGIEPPYLRVLSSERDKEGSQKFITKVSFVGLSEAELQKIRFWMNSNMGQYKRPGSAA